jgi:hypothetical protein
LLSAVLALGLLSWGATALADYTITAAIGSGGITTTNGHAGLTFTPQHLPPDPTPPGVPVPSVVDYGYLRIVYDGSWGLNMSSLITVPIELTFFDNEGPNTGSQRLDFTLTYRYEVTNGVGTLERVGISPAPPLSVTAGDYRFDLWQFLYASPTIAPGLPRADGGESLRISVVPEPASWILLGCGLTGVLGFVGSRRKNRGTT